MIISASRRTDIPARYPEWFMNRLREGEVLVQNPYNRKKIQRIALSPDVVDSIVFWSKNPEPMRPYLREIDEMGYRYYFQMTITDYGPDLEPEAPDISDAMATFLLMSAQLGKERMDWRFDPILLTEKYTKDYHLEKFEMMCEWLHRATTRCIVSFVDAYRNSPFQELEQEVPGLTRSEKRLAALLAAGLIAKEIASMIHRTPRSVGTFIYRLRKKAGVPADMKTPDYFGKLKKDSR